MHSMVGYTAGAKEHPTYEVSQMYSSTAILYFFGLICTFGIDIRSLVEIISIKHLFYNPTL